MATAKKATSKSTNSTSTSNKKATQSNGSSGLPKGTILAATAGVAAAAAAAGVAYYRSGKGSGRNGRSVYHVMPGTEGWQVKGSGAERAVSLHGTKKEALSAARDLAHHKVPSQLVVHKSDGTIQESWSYDAE